MNIKQKAAERIKRLSEKLGCDKYNLKRLIKGLVPSALSLAVVLAGFSLFSRQTLAYEVEYEGKTVGYISDVSQLEEVLNTLGSKVVGDGITLADSTTCHAKYVNPDSISDVSSLC